MADDASPRGHDPSSLRGSITISWPGGKRHDQKGHQSFGMEYPRR
jgi:hypothetical protein